jgi:serine protease Do
MSKLNGTFAAEVEALARQVLDSLVVVQQQRKGFVGRFFAGAGAGIIWRSDGLILTNNHVAGRAGLTVTLNDGRSFPAKVVARDTGFDLAMLEIEASGLSPLPAANDPVRVGMLVFALGHPFGRRNTVTRGIVSGKLHAQTRERTSTGAARSFPILRSDAPLAPGNSGGPLVNVRGELVGINAMIMGGDQSLAIPVSTVREFAARAAAVPPQQREAAHEEGTL